MSTEPSVISAITTPQPRRVARNFARADGGLKLHLQDLSLVLERLYSFYAAMHTGKPLINSDSMLSDVSGALTRNTKSRSTAQSGDA